MNDAPVTTNTPQKKRPTSPWSLNIHLLSLWDPLVQSSTSDCLSRLCRNRKGFRHQLIYYPDCQLLRLGRPFASLTGP